MKIEFTGRNFTVSPAIKRHVNEHFKKIEATINGANHVHVILSVGKHHSNLAEIVVNWHDHSLTSKADTTDMYVSATQAIERLHRQISKVKGKMIDRKHQTPSLNKSNGKGVPVLEDLIEPAPNAPRIVRSRRYAVKPMTPEEAMMRVEDAAEQFLVFRDAETERVGVIYKRKDGNFGLIEP